MTPPSTLPANELVPLLVATSFAAGLNVYATVGTIGILSHAGLLPLPPTLHLLDNWYVIAGCIALFALEFFADKIPVFDLLWNTAHTFVRVPVAALIAYEATVSLSPWEQAGVALVGGLIALAAHGGKTAVRAAVTPSPEPLSNMALSFGEDVFAVFLTWLATRHPYIAAGIALVLVIAVLAAIRIVWRSLRSLFLNAEDAVAERG